MIRLMDRCPYEEDGLRCTRYEGHRGDCSLPEIEPAIGHMIPEDDFAHIESMECGCKPQLNYVQGVGTGVCHRKIDVEPCPDTLPEDWT